MMPAETKITPEVFGRICGAVALSIQSGLTPDQTAQAMVSKFSSLDPVDVADISEGAIETLLRIDRPF
jgi:hypothetical protein